MSSHSQLISVLSLHYSILQIQGPYEGIIRETPLVSCFFSLFFHNKSDTTVL